MGAFLVWMADHYDHLQQRLRGRFEEIRREGRGSAIHARLPAAIAELQAGIEMFLEFAVEIGVIESTERERLAQKSVRAFKELVARQAKYLQASDPALRFLTLLQTALSCGGAHVAESSALPVRTGSPSHRLGARRRWLRRHDTLVCLHRGRRTCCRCGMKSTYEWSICHA